MNVPANPGVGCRMNNSMSSRWTIWRAIWAGVSLLLLGFGAKCFLDARRHQRQFDQWETAKPIDVTVDLSAPGQSTAPFHQTCSSSHSEAVLLRVPTNLLQTTTVTQLLAGLNAELEIIGQGAATPIESARAELTWGQDTIGGAIPIFFVSPFRKGDYQARLTVTSGAPALKGVPQRLEGHYLLCGIEAMPAMIGNILGLVSTIAGGLTGIIVLCLVARGRRRSELARQTTAPNAGSDNTRPPPAPG
jgi:hypothetical protein